MSDSLSSRYLINKNRIKFALIDKKIQKRIANILEKDRSQKLLFIENNIIDLTKKIKLILRLLNSNQNFIIVSLDQLENNSKQIV